MGKDDDKIRMPSGMGGIVRYFDDYKSKIEFQPGHVVAMILVIILILFILHNYNSLF